MKPSTKGVADVVFCLDASGSMAPCIAGVRRNIGAFLDGLATGPNKAIDCRFDFVVHSSSEDGSVVRSDSLRKRGAELISALYGPTPNPHAFFTTEAESLRVALEGVTAFGDEIMLLALDLCLDFPWRERATCHRVVVMMTDEPLETNAMAAEQKHMIEPIISKIQDLGVMLFLIGPASPAFETLAETDKSQYHRVSQSHDGLGTLDFGQLLSHVGKSVSMSAFRDAPPRPVRRALFGQNNVSGTGGEIKGGR